MIDFREYLMGVRLISRPVNTEETIALAFRLFDAGGKGHVTQRDVTKALAITLNMTELESDRLFSQVEKENEDYITFGELGDGGGGEKMGKWKEGGEGEEAILVASYSFGGRVVVLSRWE